MKQKITRSAAADDMLLDEAFDDFINMKEANNLAQPTIENYKMTFHIFKQYLGLDSSTLCSEINEQKIYKWINHMKNEELSISSINHYLRECRCFVNYLISKEYITPFKIKLLVGQEEKIKYFKEEDLELLIEKPRKNDSFVCWRTWAIVNLILATGARSQTICDMRIEDLNFARKEIIYSHTKNKKAQVVPLSQSLETVLKVYIKMWRPYGSGWLFPNIGDEQMTRNALRLSFEKYCNDKGVEQHNIHGLRHSFSRGWILNNGNLYALQSILGHSSTEMTKRYLKIWGEDLKEGYEDFSPLDQMKKSKSRKQTIERK